MKSAYCVVTTKAGDFSKSMVWNTELPFPIGFPLQWILEKKENWLRVRKIDLPVGKQTELSCKEFTFNEETDFYLGKLEVKVRKANSLEEPTKNIQIISSAKTSADAQKTLNQSFKKNLFYSFLSLCLFSLIAIFFPISYQAKNQIIPVEYTRIIFTPAIKKEAAEPSQKGSAKLNPLKKQTQTQVVQAFRAKALKSAVSSLLKGGMTKLLAQSDFVMGSSRHLASVQKVFDAPIDAYRTYSPHVGDQKIKLAIVTQVGGEGMGDGGGIGYQKGKHGKLQGQGKSFVMVDSFGSAVEEGLTKDEVGEVIHRHLSEIRYCYESAMIKTPDLEGKLIIHFLIGGVGSIKTAAVKTSTLPDPRLDDCVLRRLVTWKFPSPKGGIDVAVSYPFIFKTLER